MCHPLGAGEMWDEQLPVAALGVVAARSRETRAPTQNRPQPFPVPPYQELSHCRNCSADSRRRADSIGRPASAMAWAASMAG